MSVGPDVASNMSAALAALTPQENILYIHTLHSFDDGILLSSGHDAYAEFNRGDPQYGQLSYGTDGV